MNVAIYGATGMVGQGVMRACLQDPDVQRIVTVGRRASGIIDPKVRDVVPADLLDLRPHEDALRDLDACYFCLGVTSAGMSEAQYTRVTHDIAAHAGATLARLNPGMTFVFVSGMGADSSERGKVMWARVKGKAENAVLALPLRATYVFRPAAIRSSHGEVSRTLSYRLMYPVLAPVLWATEKFLPGYVTSTEKMARAMLRATRQGAPKKVLECADINALAAG
ncbi:MAG TPA: NAD(P)H-binding protein [Myxococcota bacterium]|nr:NAD(P)H-binding protein [Myxococcota bacterium]